MSKNAGIKKAIKNFQVVCRSLGNSMTGNDEIDDQLLGEIVIQAIFSVQLIFRVQGVPITYEQAELILTNAGALQCPIECHKSAIWLQFIKADKGSLLSILDFSLGNCSVLD